MCKKSGICEKLFIGRFIMTLPKQRCTLFIKTGNLTDKKFIIVKGHVDRKLLEEDLKTRKIIYHPYSKAIAQGLILPVPKMEVEEIDYETYVEKKKKK